jgi:DNA polymerase III subunit gamma/tau
MLRASFSRYLLPSLAPRLPVAAGFILRILNAGNRPRLPDWAIKYFAPSKLLYVKKTCFKIGLQQALMVTDKKMVANKISYKTFTNNSNHIINELMSYQVLARKWRPKNFEEVIGQEHVVRSLKNALSQQRLHHAYLFSGTRGVGKTTIARILAKAFNCETGITANPCGKCDACLEIDQGRYIDLIEVDAASRTKVEDTRDLLDNAQYLPTKGQFKIYIIDEVHMLSGHSFNALLKTLEEPPAHVKFLLATTDPQKLPVTVLSRCLQFNLKALSPELIQKQLQHILTREKIPYEDAALHNLALSAKGSVRDALSLLDQAIAFGHNKITTTDVGTMLGTIDTQKVFILLDALAANDANKILETISSLAELAPDFMSILDELLEILHQISLAQLISTVNTDNWQYPELVKKLARQITAEETQLYYQIGLIGKRDLLLSPSFRSGFEMVMLRMLAFRPDTQANECTPSDPIVPTDKKTADSNGTNNNINDNNLLKHLAVTGTAQALLAHSVITKNENNMIELSLDPSQAPLLNKKIEERINLALNKHYNRNIALTIKLGTPNMLTPANIKKLDDNKKRTEALLTLEKDQNIKELMNKFDAKIITNTINN